MELTKESVQELLETNDRAVMRALIVVYENQTDDEQRIQETKYRNNVGFTGVDANFGSSLAEQVIKRNSLSPKQMKCARKMVKKYWRQLIAAAEKKAAMTAEEADVFGDAQLQEAV